MAETEKLIELVRERRLLYDLSDNDYKNRDKKAEAWLQIAAEMGTEDGKHWSNKWKNLKDNYNKFQKNTQTHSGQGYKKYKNWPWADLMRFLDDFKFKRTTETNTPSQIEETNRLASQSSMIEDLNSTSCSEWDVHDPSESNTADENKKRKTKNIQEPADKVLDYLKNKNQQKQHKTLDPPDPPESNTADGNRKRKTKNIEEPTDKVLDYLKSKNQQKQHKTVDEADHLFLSYAQSYKRFSPRTQAMLKLDMATLFARYELHAVGETSVTIPVLTQQFRSTSRLSSVSSHLSTEQERPQSTLSNFSTSTDLPESILSHGVLLGNASYLQFPSRSRLSSASSHLSTEQERPQSTLSNFSTSTGLPESISSHGVLLGNASYLQTQKPLQKEFQRSQPSKAFTHHYEALAQHTLSDDDMSPTYQPNYHNM